MSYDFTAIVLQQFRSLKLIKSIKAEISNVEEWDLSAVKDVVKHILDKSIYSVGLISQLVSSSSMSITVFTEQNDEKTNSRTKLILFSQLPNHDILIEAAWPGLVIDGKGRYWDVPESISLDLLSHASGPILFHMDSRFLLDPSLGKQGSYIEDFVCSLSYSLRLLSSGKVVAWYSLKRKEGMIELRLLEF